MLSALSVCNDAVDLPAVTTLGTAVGLTVEQTEQALGVLVGASLVQSVEALPTRRYTFLTITKAAARELLDDENEQRPRAAHAYWFATHATERPIAEDFDPSWTATTIAEFADRVAAVRWLAAADPEQATNLLDAITEEPRTRP